MNQNHFTDVEQLAALRQSGHSKRAWREQAELVRLEREKVDLERRLAERDDVIRALIDGDGWKHHNPNLNYCGYCRETDWYKDSIQHKPDCPVQRGLEGAAGNE